MSFLNIDRRGNTNEQRPPMPRGLGPPEPALRLQVFVLDLEMCVADPTHVMHFPPNTSNCHPKISYFY